MASKIELKGTTDAERCKELKAGSFYMRRDGVLVFCASYDGPEAVIEVNGGAVDERTSTVVSVAGTISPGWVMRGLFDPVLSNYEEVDVEITVKRKGT